MEWMEKKEDGLHINFPEKEKNGSKKMYRVLWGIDIPADSPFQAAVTASGYMKDSDPLFQILTPEGDIFNLDLGYENKDDKDDNKSGMICKICKSKNIGFISKFNNHTNEYKCIGCGRNIITNPVNEDNDIEV